MVNGIRVCQSKVFDLYPTMASVINEEPLYNQEPRIRKTATASNVKGEESDPEKNIHHTKNSTNDIIEVAEEIEYVSLVNYCFSMETASLYPVISRRLMPAQLTTVWDVASWIASISI